MDYSRPFDQNLSQRIHNSSLEGAIYEVEIYTILLLLRFPFR